MSVCLSCPSVIYQLPLLSSAAFPYLHVKCCPGLNRYRLRPSQATKPLLQWSVQSPSSEDSALFLSLLPQHCITWWQCYIWHLIITTSSSVSLLCNSPQCTVAWGRKEASRISETYWKIFSQKDRASLDWTESYCWLSIEKYCIMRYFDPIETRLESRDREWITLWLPTHCPTLCNDMDYTLMVGNRSSSSQLNTMCNALSWLCCISPLL